MSVEDSGLLAAVNAGVAEASSAPAPAPTPEPTETPNADAHVDDSGTDGAQPVADEKAPADAGDGSGGEPGAAAAADGETPPAGGEVKPAGEADQPAVPAEPVKAPDPLNDPLPNALKRETKERIQTLVTMVKEKDTTLQTVQRDRDEILGMITETGSSPEQYGQMLGYLKLVNSPNRADREQALAVMQNEVATLARMLGKPVPGVNMLEGHNDLIEEVSIGRLSQERAQEIAAARARDRYEVQASQVSREQQNQQTAQQRALAEGRQQLNALEASLKTDPHYVAKKAALVKTLKPVFAQIDPRQWAPTFKRAYEALPTPAAPPPPPPPPPVPQNTPLRAANPAGAARPMPSSPLEALNQGLTEAR